MANRTRLLTAGAVMAAGAALAACSQPNFVDVPPPPPSYADQPPYKPLPPEDFKPLPPEDIAPGKPQVLQSPLPPPEPNFDPRGVNPGPPEGAPPRFRGPPPPPEQRYDPRGVNPPEFQGPPPPPRGRGLAGGPPPPPEFQPFKMAPIPNPEDLSPEDRAKIYGPGERAERDLAGGAPSKPSGKKPGVTKPGAKPTKHATKARPKAAPKARPSAPKTAHPAKHAPHAAAPGATPSKPAHAKPAPSKPIAPHLTAPKPTAPATTASKPVTPAPSKPVPPSAIAPAPVPAPNAKAPAAPAVTAPAAEATKSKPEQLGAALSGDVTSGSQFDTSALADGNEGVVTLSLPPSLFARLREEAAKLGLGPSARSADAQAKLSGEGYEITPNEAQSVHLKEGEAGGFTWNVKPLDGASGKLNAEVGAQLNDAGKPVDVPLASLEGKAKDTKAGAPNVMSPKVIGWGLAALVVLIILAAFGQNRTSRRQAERDRKARAAASIGEYGGANADTTTTTTKTEKP